MRISILALSIFCFFPYMARADTPFPANCANPVPDISGWETVSASRIDFRLSDNAAVYLGLAVEYADYRNPLSRGEFIRVVSRHVPFIPVRQTNPNERSFFETNTASYVQKEERDGLSELDKKTDPILYVRWRTNKEPRTGKDMRGGDVDIWFLKQNGECLIAQNEEVGTQFLTENVGNGKPHNVFVGVKYRVGKAYHILKVNRADVVQLTEGENK